MHSTWQLENGWIVSFFLPFLLFEWLNGIALPSGSVPSFGFPLVVTILPGYGISLGRQTNYIWLHMTRTMKNRFLDLFPLPISPTLSQHQIQTNPKSLSISIENVLQVKKTTLPIRLFWKTKAQFNPIQAWLFWMFSSFFLSVHHAFY